MKPPFTTEEKAFIASLRGKGWKWEKVRSSFNSRFPRRSLEALRSVFYASRKKSHLSSTARPIDIGKVARDGIPDKPQKSAPKTKSQLPASRRETDTTDGNQADAQPPVTPKHPSGDEVASPNQQFQISNEY